MHTHSDGINALSTRFWCEQVQIVFRIKDFDMTVEKYIKEALIAFLHYMFNIIGSTCISCLHIAMRLIRTRCQLKRVVVDVLIKNNKILERTFIVSNLFKKRM